MTTQIVFKLDEKLKKSVQKRAKQEGITLSDFFKSAARSFADGEANVGLTFRPEIPNAKTARLLRQIDKDVKSGKNLSPAFSNARDLIAHLESDEDWASPPFPKGI